MVVVVAAAVVGVAGVGVLFHNMDSHTGAANWLEPLVVRRDQMVQVLEEVDTAGVAVLVDRSMQAGEAVVSVVRRRKISLIACSTEKQRVLQQLAVVLSILGDIGLDRRRYCSWLPTNRENRHTLVCRYEQRI